MSTLTLNRIPRGAAPLASLAAAVILWARHRIAAARVERATQAVQELRSYAALYEGSQPSYAADLRAAADLYEARRG